MTGAWFVWSGGRTGGVFATPDAAVEHCRRVANDHRRKAELVTVHAELWRYVGPRGRRHGTRLVAFIGTARALDAIGVNVAALAGAEAATGS